MSIRELAKYSHPDFFYIDENSLLVMAAPHKAVTTASSTNTRSELRQMFRGSSNIIGTRDPRNNFALKAHRDLL